MDYGELRSDGGVWDRILSLAFDAQDELNSLDLEYRRRVADAYTQVRYRLATQIESSGLWLDSPSQAEVIDQLALVDGPASRVVDSHVAELSAAVLAIFAAARFASSSAASRVVSVERDLIASEFPAVSSAAVFPNQSVLASSPGVARAADDVERLAGEFGESVKAAVRSEVERGEGRVGMRAALVASPLGGEALNSEHAVGHAVVESHNLTKEFAYENMDFLLGSSASLKKVWITQRDALS